MKVRFWGVRGSLPVPGAKTERYGGSKLASALFFFELDRRLRVAKSPVTAIGVHPGIASTSLGRHMGIAQIAGPIVGLLLNSADKGAWPALLAATGQVKPGGYYGPTGFGGIRGAAGVARRAPHAVKNRKATARSGARRHQ